MKKILLLITAFVFVIIFQGCNALQTVKEVPKQNIQSFTNNIEEITLNVIMKDGTVYYVDTRQSYNQKDFILFKQYKDNKIDIGTLDIINFTLTGMKKPYNADLVTSTAIIIKQ